MSTHDRINSNPTHYCTNHMGLAPKAGGEYIVSANGKTRRWICASCLARRKARRLTGEARTA